MNKLEVKLEIPNVPNFIFTEYLGPPTKRQDGFKEREGIDVADLSDEILCSLADEWKIKLLEHARNRRANRDKF